MQPRIELQPNEKSLLPLQPETKWSVVFLFWHKTIRSFILLLIFLYILYIYNFFDAHLFVSLGMVGVLSALFISFSHCHRTWIYVTNQRIIVHYKSLSEKEYSFPYQDLSHIKATQTIVEKAMGLSEIHLNASYTARKAFDFIPLNKHSLFNITANFGPILFRFKENEILLCGISKEKAEKMVAIVSKEIVAHYGLSDTANTTIKPSP